MEQDEAQVAIWHFRMMNDTVRNSAYDKALGAALKKCPGSVLDIGTGSGLLALMAARHGAKKVVTCESVQAIARTAKKIIQKNGYENQIQIVEGLSTRLSVPADIQERFDILVTEIFDDGLLGEFAFQSIQHAKTHLLKPGAQIIPAKVRVMAMPIESQEVFETYHVTEISGFDVSAFNEFTVDDYVGIHLDKVKYRALAPALEVFNIDFNQIVEKESLALEWTSSEKGTLHAIAYWFELTLDENTILSSAPGLPQLSSWKQAVQIMSMPKTFQAGEKIRLTAHHNETAIWFQF